VLDRLPTRTMIEVIGRVVQVATASGTQLAPTLMTLAE
jgi:hypothetical protein